MALISLNKVSLSFGGPVLLDAVELQIEDTERLGLLGRNGAGKSTLLKVLEGSLRPDAGEVARQPGLRVASLPQDLPQGLSGAVRAYLHAARGVVKSDARWELEAQIERAARDLTLDLDADLATLSAGSKRRVLVAAALVGDPDVLILDEPTNHLDIDAIRHLEGALLRRRGALVFVTHDRTFLRKLATRILDLDRGVLRSFRCSYDAYLEKKDEQLRVEAEQAALFDKKLAQEEAWVRRGIKARRTRNEGRVRALQALRLERGARRDEVGRVKAELQAAERSGRIVLRVQNLGFAYGAMPSAMAGTPTVGDSSPTPRAGTPIVRGLTMTIQRGDRIGILGPNGCGKTTLIDLLLGDLAPQEGSVTAGTKLEVAHFEQLHDVLDDTKTVIENVAGGREMIPIGRGERHAVGYLRDFLFTPEQIQAPVRMLSGGERKRLQLAKVLAKPCNVLVLDEPTNDLDLETLELLEDLLLEFQGTLLVVSHDRAFLDNVVTSTLVFEGDGVWREYVGGYDDWQRQSRAVAPPDATKAARPKAPTGQSTSTRPSSDARPARPRRMTFNEKRALEALPGEIERLEAEKQELLDLMASPEFYKTRGEEAAEVNQRLAAVEARISESYAQWEELEALATEAAP